MASPRGGHGWPPHLKDAIRSQSEQADDHPCQRRRLRCLVAQECWHLGRKHALRSLFVISQYFIVRYQTWHLTRKHP